MGSCVSTLRRIQEDCGITDKDLKRAVHNIATPREVTLEEISVTYGKKELKAERQREKLQNKTTKRRRQQMAYWYLEEYLRPEYAMREFYMKYDDPDELLEAAYQEVLGLVQLRTFELGPASWEDVFEPEPSEPWDIPESQEEAFEKWCKKHPLRGYNDIIPRRERFLKSLRKVKRKYYSKKRLGMYDPLFAQTYVDEKEMLDNLKHITAQNELRIREFHEMLESLYKNNGISRDVMKKFDKQTDELMKHHRRRLNEFIKRTGKEKPTPVSLDIDDEPRVVFDDWDNPDSIDSVLKIPIRDC